VPYLRPWKRAASGSRTGAAQPEEDFVAVLKLSPTISTSSAPLEYFCNPPAKVCFIEFLLLISSLESW
jgi:hypothetical protein